MQRTTLFYNSGVLQTPSDTTGVIVDSMGNSTRPCNAFMVGIAGGITVLCWGDTVPVLLAVEPGVIYPIALKYVFATGTTSDILLTALFNERMPPIGTSLGQGAGPE